MMDYKGVKIYFFEGKQVQVLGIDKDAGDYTVNAPAGGLLFQASSEYGASYALDAETALDGAKKQIDEALAK